ncbi:efflux RND transporter periplasmic adaptor subunit [Aminipila luticellarii]|uniref:Efflux RND transporter periplasmic adaptor subunit n=1 Tax=Aminipila luticellarii TaxID=2507160 RepID=A0A410PWR8_9FIRM|nr:efflux RND transporter periplasmic adaptor subunit [Aminipila luticellarii]QAT43381.1 efflux RND transporter periplasmic adaptor subunit [Aminipila luticellarii]
MEKINKKTLMIIIGIILIILLVVIGVKAMGTKSSEANQDVYSQQQPDELSFIMAGKVEAIESADVSVKTPGKIAELNVDVGDAVHKGDVLGRIDMKEIPAQANQAQSTIDIANVNLTNAQSNYDRTLQLYQSGAVAKEALESAEKQLNTASAQVRQAQAGLEIINANSSNGVIVAPVSGIVASKNVNEGEMAVAGAPLMSIVNPDQTYISAYLPARLSDSVKQGQKVTIKISELQDKLFDGQISLVDPVVDSQNKNILVKVNMLENDPAVKVGMFAEIALKK